ncbi:hypothetical protein FA15DRAFT_665962, partial [Coprinopsis marcescibilis]
MAFIAAAVSQSLLGFLLMAGVVERLRFFRQIAVELPIVALSWLAWLIHCILLFPWSSKLFPSWCGHMTSCYEFYVLGAISVCNCAVVFVYWLILLVCSAIGRSRSNIVWSRSVQEVSFFSRPSLLLESPTPISDSHNIRPQRSDCDRPRSSSPNRAIEEETRQQSECKRNSTWSGKRLARKKDRDSEQSFMILFPC